VTGLRKGHESSALSTCVSRRDTAQGQLMTHTIEGSRGRVMVTGDQHWHPSKRVTTSYPLQACHQLGRCLCWGGCQRVAHLMQEPLHEAPQVLRGWLQHALTLENQAVPGTAEVWSTVTSVHPDTVSWCLHPIHDLTCIWPACCPPQNL
jgi:hypothetical protein